MIQEDKDLLLKDLCARLPYNFVYCYCNAPLAKGNPIILTPVVISNLMNATDDLVIKPYLRPMSSMTVEEKKEYDSFSKPTGHRKVWINRIDWLNRKVFDYRELIKKGLALEALEGMYKGELL